jgi:hypothetical protein
VEAKTSAGNRRHHLMMFFLRIVSPSRCSLDPQGGVLASASADVHLATHEHQPFCGWAVAAHGELL